jgi:hypothetical protein
MRALLASAVAILGAIPGAGLAVLAVLAGLAACGNSERAGAEEAQRQAQAEQSARQATAPAAKMSPPVRGEARIPCAQLIDPAVFQVALKEKQPLTVKDITRTFPDAAAACSLLRGGKRPSEAEQQAIVKHNGRLGVLPGDELCQVIAICSKIMDLEQFRASCKQRKERDDDSLGSYACVRINAVGADDVEVFQLLDDDTHCILEIRGGPSNVDNGLIRGCAKTARDAIGPAQIQVDPAAGSAAGSASPDAPQVKSSRS